MKLTLGGLVSASIGILGLIYKEKVYGTITGALIQTTQGAISAAPIDPSIKMAFNTLFWGMTLVGSVSFIVGLFSEFR